jgi:hypothetical protein
METLPKLERIRRLTLTPGMKLVCMSDMHRGDGSGADDFAQNSLIYRCALEHYLENGFTYVELGDAEELWENENFDQIYITHTSVYELLAKFHDPDPAKTRYLKVWGNHDLYWKDNEAVYRTLFPGIEIKNQPDGSYYNTGSCVHSLCIIGIEITFENGPRLRLIEWGQATEGNALTIQRTVLEETELGCHRGEI